MEGEVGRCVGVDVMIAAGEGEASQVKSGNELVG